MRRIMLCLSLIWGAAVAQADTGKTVEDAINFHVLPRMAQLQATTDSLSKAALADCTAESPYLRQAFDDAFDAWLNVSHLQFGPLQSPARRAKFADPTSATQGFFALEHAMFAPKAAGASAAGCQAIQEITAGLAHVSSEVLAGWQVWAVEVNTAAGVRSPAFRDPVVREQFVKAVQDGLQDTIDLRLALPLGTADAPQPMLAEARLSLRSQRHIWLSIASVAELSEILGQDRPHLQAELAQVFEAALNTSIATYDPVLDGVADLDHRAQWVETQHMLNAIKLRVSDLSEGAGGA